MFDKQSIPTIPLSAILLYYYFVIIAKFCSCEMSVIGEFGATAKINT